MDPDGRDYEPGEFGNMWSFESAFDEAFQWDFGESGKTFVEKAPERLDNSAPFKAWKAAGLEFTGAGDAIRIVGGIDPYTYKPISNSDRLQDAVESAVFLKADKIAHGVGALVKSAGFAKSAEKGSEYSSKLFKVLETGTSLRNWYKGVIEHED